MPPAPAAAVGSEKPGAVVGTMKAGRENWVGNDSATHCVGCSTEFGMLTRKHHCRACGHIFCGKCTSKEINYTPHTRKGEEGYTEKKKRVCETCFQNINTARKRAAEVRSRAIMAGLVCRKEVEMEELFAYYFKQLSQQHAPAHDRGPGNPSGGGGAQGEETTDSEEESQTSGGKNDVKTNSLLNLPFDSKFKRKRAVTMSSIPPVSLGGQ